MSSQFEKIYEAGYNFAGDVVQTFRDGGTSILDMLLPRIDLVRDARYALHS